MRPRIPSQGDDITDHTTQKERQDVLMRLPDFIQANMQRILDDAVDFAITQAPEGAQLNHKRLRNDIPLILRDIVADLRTPQSAAEQRDKAQGRTAHATSPESAASSHGRSRADDGFGVNQMIAEYRALRASVLHLWAADQALSGDAIDDMMRFNEAIDQAVAESLLEFSRTVESWRNVFLGALGHDLRGPLAAVVGTAELLADTAQGTPHAHQAARILSAAAAADWAPISSAGVLHDRASYRYYWQLLERAHQTGRALPEAVQRWFYDGSPSSFSSESP